MDGADLGHGCAEFAGQLEGVDVAAARLHQVAHVEQDQGGQAERKDRRGQHQLAGEVQGIENQQDSVGLGRAGHFAAQHVDGDAGILRVGGEGVDAGQVDEGEVVAADAGHQAHALLDGDAGVVGDLLAQTGQAIEKSGLAGVGRADEDDGLERSRGAAALGAAQRPELRSRRSSRGLERALRVFGFGSFRSSWRRAAFADADGFCGLVAKGDFHAVDAVDGGVAGRGAAQGGDQRIGDKAHMHQVVLDGFRQVEGHQDPALADLQFAQHAQPPNSRGLPKGQHPKTTTGMVGFQYTTNLV